MRPTEETITKDRREAIATAQKWLKSDAVIFDTETTGLHDKAVIVEIAVINLMGEVLLNTLVKLPKNRKISQVAQEKHGITAQDCKVHGRPWLEVMPEFIEMIKDKDVIAYNLEYDTRLLYQTTEAWVPDFENPCDYPTQTCLMLLYAQYRGEWNNRYGEYKWHKLEGEHRALGDCNAALERLKTIAFNLENLPLYPRREEENTTDTTHSISTSTQQNNQLVNQIKDNRFIANIIFWSGFIALLCLFAACNSH